jgi:hypothetical protein
MKSFLKSALLSGSIVGVLDGTAACVNAYLASSVFPDRVFRFVASGFFGPEAYTADSSMIVWGLFFHFIIAIGWTFLFFILYNRINFLSKHVLLSGMIYGLIIWLAMNLLIVPMSQIGPRPFAVKGSLIMIGIHLFVIGVPISYLANRFLRNR